MSTSTTAEHFLSWEEFHRDTRQLASQLLDRQWQGVIGIARGGLIPAAIIARELGIRLVDTVCISSYDHQSQADAPRVLKTVEGDGAGWLLVDDLVDTGNTAAAAQALLPRATLVTVYAKPQGQSRAALHVRQFPQAVWIHFPWDSAHHYAPPLAGSDKP